MDYTESLELEVNRWLDMNPGVRVIRTEQSLAIGWFGRPYCVITLWYEPSANNLLVAEAEKRALEVVSRDFPGKEVIVTEIIERSFGWVFCFNSKSFVETGDERHALKGCFPILVDRRSATVHKTGPEPLDVYVQRYERFKTTGAEPDSEANRSQPVRSGTVSNSSGAGSRR